MVVYVSQPTLFNAFNSSRGVAGDSGFRINLIDIKRIITIMFNVLIVFSESYGIKKSCNTRKSQQKKPTAHTCKCAHTYSCNTNAYEGVFAIKKNHLNNKKYKIHKIIKCA